MSSSRVPSSRTSSSGTSRCRNHVFLHGIWREPNFFYSVILGSPNPDPAMTQRFTFIQATLSDNVCLRFFEPRESIMGGLYVTGMTEAEVQKMDNFHEGMNCVRLETRVQFICRHGNTCTRKALIWLPRQPMDGIQAWDAAQPSGPSGGSNGGPNGGPNGGANGGAHGFNPGATQGSSLTFGGAAFAA
ncbi:hypothetical protein LY76DRAFT_619298 [Colletotrichum caudatum]|nr:hypothetical protein LY76DRAFT_619298 [Colletotrichum caudatum]